MTDNPCEWLFLCLQGCTDCGDEVPSISDAQPLDDQGARVFKFWVLNRDGKKLPHNHAKALLYALGTGLGFSSQRFPLMPPNREYHRG